jgi:DNA polymerase III delta prime subunit
MHSSQLLWVEKYRPQKVEECILPKETLEQLQAIIESGKLPNMLFSGSAGIGKTTVAHALGEQMGYDVLFVNASNEGRSIDTLRGLITTFASSMSLEGNRKLVILDEFDGVGQVIQDALRAFIEQYSVTTSFILTCNYKHKLIPAIHSRFSEINFTIPSDQKAKLQVAFMARIANILKSEKVEYENLAIKEIATKYFPDFRRTLNELQRFSAIGTFKVDQLKSLEVDYNSIFEAIRNKQFTEMIALVEKASTIDISSVATELYNNADKFCTSGSKPVLVNILAEYIDKATRTTNPKITVMAMYANIMANVDMV